MANKKIDETPECFKKGWDAISDQNCQNCSGQHLCKDGFINGPLHEVLTQSPQATDEQLSQLFGITLPSIQALRAEYVAIMGGGNTAPPPVASPPQAPPQTQVQQFQQPPVPPQPPISIPQQPQMVIPQVQPPVQVPVQERPIPAKKRKGKPPRDLVTCPSCGGTGWGADGNMCSVCGGLGDISQKKLATPQGQSTQSPQVATGAQAVSNNSIPSPGYGATPTVAGGGSPSPGTAGVLPIQRAAFPNIVQPSTANSGTDSVQKEVQSPKSTKTGNVSGKLERGEVFSIDSILSLSDGKVKSVIFSNTDKEIRLIVGLK